MALKLFSEYLLTSFKNNFIDSSMRPNSIMSLGKLSIGAPLL